MLPKNEKNFQDLKKLSKISVNEIIEAYANDMVKEYVIENAFNVHRDGENDITHIVFSQGGPYVYLDFDEQPGLIIAKDFDTKAHSAIPLETWIEIRNELEETYE